MIILNILFLVIGYLFGLFVIYGLPEIINKYKNRREYIKKYGRKKIHFRIFAEEESEEQ